jgi:hypothetical protein
LSIRSAFSSFFFFLFPFLLFPTLASPHYITPGTAVALRTYVKPRKKYSELHFKNSYHWRLGFSLCSVAD